MMARASKTKPLLALPTQGRVLVHAATVYDAVQPFVTLGQENRLNAWLAAQLEIEDHGSIIDIGCGTGLLTWQIARRHPGCTVIGIDASLPMIEVARRKRSIANCDFRQAVAEDLPYEAETFSVVTSALFFHHVNREFKLRALKEAWRVLKPGGRLYIADMGRPYTILGWAMSVAGWLLLRQPEIKENIDGILPDLISEAGFDDCREIGKWSGYITAIVAQKKENGDASLFSRSSEMREGKDDVSKIGERPPFFRKQV